jgi:hypothetical protein
MVLPQIQQLARERLHLGRHCGGLCPGGLLRVGSHDPGLIPWLFRRY